MKKIKIVLSVILVIIFINAGSIAYFPILSGKLNFILALVLVIPFFMLVIYGVLKTHTRGTKQFGSEFYFALEWFIYLFGIILNYSVIYSYLDL